MTVAVETPFFSNLEECHATVLDGVSWRSYETLLEDSLPVRLIYDRGRLEIVSPTRDHEKSGMVLHRFIVVITEELDLSMDSSGSTTLRREDLAQGLEGDHSYYLANEPAVRGKRQIDLRVDPPPDLAVEIEPSRSAIHKMDLYQALRVPEVWRCDALDTIHVHVLQVDGTYRVVERSLAFPFLPMAELMRFYHLRWTMSENALAKAFRAWLRSNLDESGKWRV